MEKKREPGHPGFLALLDRMRAMHIAKDADYAGDRPPFDNFRAATEIGLKPSQLAVGRMQDKFKRIQNLLCREQQGTGPAVRDESIEDTLLDLSSYALIVLVLRNEEAAAKFNRTESPRVAPHVEPQPLTDMFTQITGTKQVPAYKQDNECCCRDIYSFCARVQNNSTHYHSKYGEAVRDVLKILGLKV